MLPQMVLCIFNRLQGDSAGSVGGGAGSGASGRGLQPSTRPQARGSPALCQGHVRIGGVWAALAESTSEHLGVGEAAETTAGQQASPWLSLSPEHTARPGTRPCPAREQEVANGCGGHGAHQEPAL